jgi:hypothetical protein
VVLSRSDAAALREAYGKLMRQGCRVLPFLALDRPRHAFTMAATGSGDGDQQLSSAVSEGGAAASSGGLGAHAPLVDDLDQGIAENNAFAAGANSNNHHHHHHHGGSGDDDSDEVSCALIMALLGAPLQQCRDDRFGVFRVPRARAMGPFLPSPSMLSSSSSSLSSSVSSTSLTTEAILDAPACDAPHIAGHWDEVLATAMAVVRSVRPVAIVWVERQDQQPLSAFEQTAIGAVHALVGILRAQPEVGFVSSVPQRKPRFRGYASSSAAAGSGISPLPFHFDHALINPGHLIASVLASVKAPPYPEALEVRYLR